MMPPVTVNSALFLDIDGTLLDIAPTPDTVVVPDGLRDALETLYETLDGALAFVSGRSLSAIDHLFAPLRTAAVGCHGAEVRSHDGTLTTLAAPVPAHLKYFLTQLAAAHPGVLLEDKTYALALHYRLAPEARPALFAAVASAADLFADANYTVLHGKAVIDVKPRGIDKGVGVRALLAQKPFAGRHVIFGGDDTTDGDVFRLLPEWGGEGFSVGKPFAGAAYMVETPGAVRHWLAGVATRGVA